MSQTDYLSIQRGKARVIIKTNNDDNEDLPRFELDMKFTKDEATKIMVYAMQIKAESEAIN